MKYSWVHLFQFFSVLLFLSFYLLIYIFFECLTLTCFQKSRQWTSILTEISLSPMFLAPSSSIGNQLNCFCFFFFCDFIESLAHIYMCFLISSSFLKKLVVLDVIFCALIFVLQFQKNVAMSKLMHTFFYIVEGISSG